MNPHIFSITSQIEIAISQKEITLVLIVEYRKDIAEKVAIIYNRNINSGV